MKKAIVLLAVFGLIGFGGYAYIDSKIKEVTVFLRGAQVIRTGTIQLSAGTNEIMFYDLPDNLSPESIQVSGKGNFTILSVVHQINYLKAQEKSQEVLDLEKKLKDLEQKVATENVTLAVYKHEEDILSGDFKRSLLEKCRYEAQMSDIIQLCVDKVYQSSQVIEKEIAGYQVISDLLDVFITAANNKQRNAASNYDKLILMMMPEKYQNLPGDLYERVLRICNLVANYSDSQAILLHKKIKGIDLN